MFGRLPRIGRTVRSGLAWSGLLFMIASFAWLQWLSKPEGPVETRAPARREPFAVVVLDPGHGGQDSGAMCGGVLEKDLTLDIAQRVDRLLQAEGVASVMTRVGDSYVSLADRAAFANRVRDCIFVSLHFNEDNKPVANGVETYYADHQIIAGFAMASWLPFLRPAVSESPNPESQSLAAFIQEALVARTQAANRGTKARQLYVIANVTNPAVLVEGGFLTNKETIARLADSNYREQIAAAISEGILRYRSELKQRQQGLAVTGPAGPE